jgi:hypothetical protein
MWWRHFIAGETDAKVSSSQTKFLSGGAYRRHVAAAPQDLPANGAPAVSGAAEHSVKW